MGGRKDGIRCPHGVLEHCVGEVVDEIGVVARTAEHDVGACVAVENVVSAVTVKGVAAAVAISLQVGTALQDQVFYVVRKPEVGGRIDRIGALTGILEHRVGEVVDDIHIVAVATRHLVRAAPPLRMSSSLVGRGWLATVCVASIKSLPAVPLMVTPATFCTGGDERGERHSECGRRSIAVTVNDLNRDTEIDRVGALNGSTEVSDLEGITGHPGVFDRVITIGGENRDRRCAGVVPEHAADVNRPIGVLGNRVGMSSNRVGREKRLRQIDEARGASAKANHDARYRIFDAIADNTIAIRIIKCCKIDSATQGRGEVGSWNHLPCNGRRRRGLG